MIDAYADRWALITGASSGIGAEFARVLAARGMHLLLTARRRPLLEELAEELHTRHGTKSQIITADLADPAAPGRLVDEIRSREIDVELLINNAGFGFVGTVEETDVDRMRDLIQVNVTSLTELTLRLLPPMLERRHGAVINVASLAGFQPVAYMPVYASTKAYVLHFSEALWAEVRDRGVTVTALCPGTTHTAFFDVAGVPNWLKKHSSSSPAQVVKAALRAMEKRRQFVVPGWKNYLVTLGSRIARRREVVLQSMRYFRPPSDQAAKRSTAPTGPSADPVVGSTTAGEPQSNTTAAAKTAGRNGEPRQSGNSENVSTAKSADARTVANSESSPQRDPASAD